MSRAWEGQLRRQEHQRFHEDRVRRENEERIARYRAILDDVEAQGLGGLAAEELASARADIDRVDQVNRRDPFEARSLRRELGPRIGPLPQMARRRRSRRPAHAATDTHSHQADHSSARRSVQDRPAPPRRELDDVWAAEIGAWDDLLSRELARSQIAELYAKLSDANGQLSTTELKDSLRTLKQRFDAEADLIREKQRREIENLSAEVLLDEAREEVRHAENLDEEQRRHLLQRLEAGADSPDAIVELVDETLRELDELAGAGQMSGEETRRAAAAGIYQAMRTAGFIMEKPVKEAGEDGDVIIRGVKPGGAQAEFRLDISSHVDVRFDRYRGRACESDIDRVTAALQDAYGIELSTERVVWENPDDNDAEARPSGYRSR